MTEFLQPVISRYWTSGIGLCLHAAIVLSLNTARAQQADEFYTGREFQRQLESEVFLQLPDNPLRDALESVSRQLRIAIVLDRRVDPTQHVQWSVDHQALETALDQLTEQLRLGWSAVGPVIYIGPPDTAAKLATLAEQKKQEAGSLPPELRRSVLRARPWSWPRLATPRELLEELAQEAGLELLEVEQIPHDLWPEVQLPPLSLAERLTLALAGFHLTYEIVPNQRALRLVAIPEQVSLERQYRLPRGEETFERLQRLLPDVAMQRQGAGLHVQGTLEQHQMVQRLLENRRPARSSREEELRYSLTVNGAAIGDVLEQLAIQFKLEVQASRQAQPVLRRRASLDVDEVTLEELLDQLLTPAGLTYRLEGQTLVVTVDQE